jgi:hypothetical protein
VSVSNYAQWSYMGLNNILTTDLTIYGDTIYASTYDGIYKKNVFSSDTIWYPCGMQGRHVVQTLVPNHQTFICVAEINSSRTTEIYKSIDGGDSFSLMVRNISSQNSYNYLDKIAHPEENYDTLYFLDHRLRTFDGGITWDTLSNIIQLVNRFIKVNPANHNQIIIGGETMIFSPYLQTSYDHGENWDILPNMNSYFAGDNSVHDMVFNGEEWFAVGEGVIGKTSDEGRSWEQLLNMWDYPEYWGLYITDIEFSPQNKNILYATGCGYSVNIVPLLYSSDCGQNWDTLSFIPTALPEDTLTNVTCLTVKNIEGNDNVFIGGQGIYVYENNSTGIAKPVSGNSFTVYPNPVKDRIQIRCSDFRTYNGKITIFSMEGKKVSIREVRKGDDKIELDLANLESGMYLCKVMINNSCSTTKIIKE